MEKIVVPDCEKGILKLGEDGIMIIRLLICSMVLALVGAFTGCCGVSGRVSQCNGCNDGYGGGASCSPRPTGPLDALMSWRRELVCGSGCGEVYHGEWISTPPDCNDPCCGGQFVGGAVKARPFCVQPGTIFGNLSSLYGTRNCEFCGNAFTDCGCGDSGGIGGDCGGGCGCGGCGGEIVQGDTFYDAGTVIDSGYGGEVINSGPSCSTCNSGSSAGNTRIAGRQITHQGMTQQHYHQRRRTAQRR